MPLKPNICAIKTHWKSATQKSRFYASVKKGYSCREIAKQLGKGKSTVNDIILKHKAREAAAVEEKEDDYSDDDLPE